MVTFDEIRKQLRTPIQSKTTPNIPSFDEIRNTVRAETVQNNLQIMRANPTPKPQPLPDISPTPQPLQSNFIDSYLKPFQPSNNADYKQMGYYIGGRPVIEGNKVIKDNSPFEILKDNGNTYTVKLSDGKLTEINKPFVSSTPNNSPEAYEQAAQLTDQNFMQRRKQEYAAKNPIDRFFTKATDIGFMQDDKTPSLGNPVADVAASLVGNIMGLATPTGGGQSVGGAMNLAGDIVEQGVNKYGGKLINKLPNLAQKIAPKMIKEVGEGLVYSASKSPDYTAKDWAQNALEDATIGTGLGFAMDGLKKLPDAIKNAQLNKADNAKSKAIDEAYKALKTDMFPSQKTNTQTNLLKPYEPKPMVKPTTLSKTLTLKNQGEQTAYKRLEEGITKAQNYFGTNELRTDEMAQFKNDTGIDLIKLADDYAMQSGKSNQQVFNEIVDKSKFKRIAGLAGDKTYKALNTIVKQEPKKPIINIDGQKYTADIPLKKNIKPVERPIKNNIVKTDIDPKIKELVVKAEQLKTQYEKITPNVVQKEFHVGYADAAKVVDEMNNPLKDSWLQTFAGEDMARKQSQFAQNTLKRTTIIPDDIKEKLKLDKFDYIHQTSKLWQENAIKNIEADEASVIRKIYENPAISGGTQAHEAAILTAKLVKESEETGSTAKLGSWLSTVTGKTRETARALKGTDTAYEKVSKEGKLIQAQRAVDSVEEDLAKTNPVRYKQMKDEIENTKKSVKRAKKEAAKQATDEVIDEIAKEFDQGSKDSLTPKALKPKDSKLNPNNKKPNNLPKKNEVTPEEMLANKIKATLKDPKKKNDPVKTMVNELFKIAKESPLPEREKFKSKTPFEFMEEAIRNKAEYREVWSKAKNILKEKFKDNEEAFNLLDDYFTRNNPVKPVLSNQRINQSVTLALKDLGLKLDTIARQNTGDKDKFLSDITKYIVDKTNATIEKDEASRLAKRIQKRYFELVDKKAKSILEQMSKTMPEKQMKTYYEKLRELNNLGAFEDGAIALMVKEKYGIPSLSNEDIKFIMKTMDIIKDKDPMSYEYRAAMSKVNEKIVNKLPVTKQEKLQAYSRIMMLFNPKTLVTRNPLGNAILGGFEAFKDMPSALVDMYISAKYKVDRQTLFPSLDRVSSEFSGAKKGLKEFGMDIKRKVDTSETGAQYELPKYGKRIFQNPVLNFLDQVTRKGLQAGDRPFFEASKNARLNELKKIKGTKTVTNEMLEDAINYAMERTYQNKSKMSDGAKGLQKNINIIGSKIIPGTNENFGLGNLAMPFTTTPANILQKAIEYSPLGILDTVKAWKDFRKGVTTQKQFTSLVGRMFTGTGLILLGWELAKNKMASGKGSNSSKERAFNTATGENQYSIKIGTNRFTFDWADPLSLPLAVGIDMMEAGKDKEDTLDAISKGLISGGDTFFRKSFMRGLSQMMGGYSPTQGIVNTVLGSATQFTPSAGNTGAKMVDNTRRETYDPNKMKELLNKVVISRTPFLSKTLPAKIDTMGKEMKQSEAPGALKVLDVALSPGYYSKQKETQGIKFIKDLYEETGDTKVFPKEASKTITIKDKITKESRKIELTTREWTQLQKTIGLETMSRIEDFARNNNVKSSDPDKLVKEVYKIIDEVVDNATEELQEKYKKKLGFN